MLLGYCYFRKRFRVLRRKVKLMNSPEYLSRESHVIEDTHKEEFVCNLFTPQPLNYFVEFSYIHR